MNTNPVRVYVERPWDICGGFVQKKMHYTVRGFVWRALNKEATGLVGGIINLVDIQLWEIRDEDEKN